MMYLYQENLSLVWVNMHVCRYAYISMYRMCMLVYVYVQACMYHICFRYRITLIRNAQTQKEITEKNPFFMKVSGCGCVHACACVSCTHMYMNEHMRVCTPVYIHAHSYKTSDTSTKKFIFSQIIRKFLQATSESGLLYTSESGLFINLVIFYRNTKKLHC